MTPAYDIERVASACDALTRAIAAALVHDLPDWMSHRLHTMYAEASALVAILRQHAPDVQPITDCNQLKGGAK